jgi:hypothetical protein
LGQPFAGQAADISMLKSDLEFFRTIYRFFADADRLTWASIGVAVVVGFLYFRMFFPRRNGFSDIPDDNSDRTDSRWLGVRELLLILISGSAGLLA